MEILELWVFVLFCIREEEEKSGKGKIRGSLNKKRSVKTIGKGLYCTER